MVNIRINHKIWSSTIQFNFSSNEIGCSIDDYAEKWCTEINWSFYKYEIYLSCFLAICISPLECVKTDSRAKIQRSKHFFELWTPLMIAFNFVARRGIQSTFLTFYDFVLCYKQASSAGWVLFWHWYWYICSKTRSIAYTFLQKIQHKFEINTSARNGIVRSSTDKRCATSKCISFSCISFSDDR